MLDLFLRPLGIDPVQFPKDVADAFQKVKAMQEGMKRIEEKLDLLIAKGALNDGNEEHGQNDGSNVGSEDVRDAGAIARHAGGG